MRRRKTKKAIYFIREARELFDRTAAFMALTAFTLVAHISGKHHKIMTQNQAVFTLYSLMNQINRNNGSNRSAAIPEKENGCFIGIRRIPPTPEGKEILFAYRQKRMDVVNKLLQTQIEIIKMDKTKGILTAGQIEKLKNSTLPLLEGHEKSIDRSA